jgi:hypothetical protein
MKAKKANLELIYGVPNDCHLALEFLHILSINVIHRIDNSMVATFNTCCDLLLLASFSISIATLHLYHPFTINHIWNFDYTYFEVRVLRSFFFVERHFIFL